MSVLEAPEGNSIGCSVGIMHSFCCGERVHLADSVRQHAQHVSCKVHKHHQPTDTMLLPPLQCSLQHGCCLPAMHDTSTQSTVLYLKTQRSFASLIAFNMLYR